MLKNYFPAFYFQIHNFMGQNVTLMFRRDSWLIQVPPNPEKNVKYFQSQILINVFLCCGLWQRTPRLKVNRRRGHGWRDSFAFPPSFRGGSAIPSSRDISAFPPSWVRTILIPWCQGEVWRKRDSLMNLIKKIEMILRFLWVRNMFKTSKNLSDMSD